MNIDKPSKVRNAERLLYCSLGFMLFVDAIGKFIYPIAFTSPLLILIIRCTILFILTYMIGKGKNWARIIFLILFILSFPGIVLNFGALQDLSNSLDFTSIIKFFLFINAINIIIQGFACVLLFKRQSSDWFRQMKDLNEMTQPPSNN